MKSLVFGIEKEFFNKITKAENNKYDAVARAIMFISLVSFCSFGYLGYMVFKDLLLCIFTGLFFGLTFFLIIQFSISSIQMDYSSSLPKWKYFRLSFLTKFFFFLFLSFVTVVPFGCLVFRLISNNHIIERKQELVSDFQDNLKESKNSFLYPLHARLKKNNTEINSINDSIQKLNSPNEYAASESKLILAMFEKKLDDLKLKEQQLQLELITLQNEQNAKDIVSLKNYISSLDKSELPLFQFYYLLNHPFGSTLVLVFSGLILWILITVTKLTYDEKYELSKIVLHHHKKIISEQYNAAIKECSSILLDKYNHSYSFVTKYKDPPFNTILESKDV